MQALSEQGCEELSSGSLTCAELSPSARSPAVLVMRRLCAAAGGRQTLAVRKRRRRCKRFTASKRAQSSTAEHGPTIKAGRRSEITQPAAESQDLKLPVAPVREQSQSWLAAATRRSHVNTTHRPAEIDGKLRKSLAPFKSAQAFLYNPTKPTATRTTVQVALHARAISVSVRYKKRLLCLVSLNLRRSMLLPARALYLAITTVNGGVQHRLTTTGDLANAVRQELLAHPERLQRRSVDLKAARMTRLAHPTPEWRFATVVRVARDQVSRRGRPADDLKRLRQIRSERLMR